MTWVSVPDLAVERSEQRYEPLGANTVRFRAGSFEADPVLDDDGFVISPGTCRARRKPVTERLRLWLERGGGTLRDAATGEPVRWEDDRSPRRAGGGCDLPAGHIRAGVLRPGRRLALVPEPDNVHDPNAVGIWNEERTLQAGYVPREVAGELAGDEQAVSLWRVEGGLRVLIVPADAWVGRPRS